ncbi:MAG: hypothetical protein WCK82_14695, partial [Bacteroidota bacterium]
MKNSHLTETLKTLTPAEIERFTNFMTFDQEEMQEESINLLNNILKYYPKFDSESLDKQNLFSVVFPEKVFVDGKIDKIMVRINKCLKKFLLMEYYLNEKNEFNQLLDLSKIYKNRGLIARYEQTINQIETTIIKKNKQSFKSALEKFQFEYEKHEWLSFNNKQNDDLNISNTIKALFEYYQIFMVELINKYQMQQKVKQLPILTINEHIIDSVSYTPNEDDFFFELQFVQKKINSIIKKGNTNTIEINNLSLFLDKNFNVFDNSIMKLLYAYQRNCCIILRDRGVPNLETLLFDLQKEHLGKGYFFHNNKIASNTYISIASTALLLKDYKWTIAFIETYKDKILGDTPDRIYYKLNLSKYYFAINEFEKSLQILSVNFPEISYSVNARRLEIKSYFEIKSELVSYKLDALKMYINRISQKSLPVEKKEHQLNFINLFSQIVQSIPGDK